MANSKRLHAAAAKFRRNNPSASFIFGRMCSAMAQFILSSGAPEVTCGIEEDRYGLKQFVCHANS